MDSIIVNGQRLEYEFIGAGPLIVLVNNPILSLQGQRIMADPFVKAGRRVLIIENHGPDSASVTEFAAAVAGVLDANKLRSVCLLGWSQGAVIIGALAIARPDLAGRIVLLATTGRSTAFFDRFVRAYLDTLSLTADAGENMRSVLMMLGQLSPAMIMNDAVIALTAGATTPPERHRRAFSATDTPGIDALRAVSAPSLVIGFEDDLLIPAALSREVAGAIKGARYAEIAGATHNAPFTHAKQIMDLALPFFDESSGT